MELSNHRRGVPSSGLPQEGPTALAAAASLASALTSPSGWGAAFATDSDQPNCPGVYVRPGITRGGAMEEGAYPLA